MRSSGEEPRDEIPTCLRYSRPPAKVLLQGQDEGDSQRAAQPVRASGLAQTGFQERINGSIDKQGRGCGVHSLTTGWPPWSGVVAMPRPPERELPFQPLNRCGDGTVPCAGSGRGLALSCQFPDLDPVVVQVWEPGRCIPGTAPLSLSRLPAKEERLSHSARILTLSSSVHASLTPHPWSRGVFHPWEALWAAPCPSA